TLTITPKQSQFFQYDRIALTCVSNSKGWTVKRSINNQPPQECKYGWAIPSESSCIIENAYPSDTATTVILESPVDPVLEGEHVTLGCSYKEEDDPSSTSDFSAHFYKDEVFIGTQKPGKMIIKAEEGFYKCRHPFKGVSPKSWLAVRARVKQVEVSPPPLPPPPDIPWTRVICGILLFILYNFILILCIWTYRRWARARADVNGTEPELKTMR
ncbi:hypothetical protein ILYODFUR_032255, partial [Ilyodon furcidens]